MSKKLFLLISFVLVLGLVDNTWAYGEFHWTNNNGTGDRLWDTTTNWDCVSGCSGPGPHLIGSDDWVVIDELYTDDGNGPIIDGNTAAACEWLTMGWYAGPPDEAVLTMTGGTLTVGDYFDMGDYYAGNYRFEMQGGVFGGTGQLRLAYPSGSQATVNMTGGTIDLDDDIEIGTATGYGEALFNMTAGEVYVGDWLIIGAYDTATADGHLDLQGGTFETHFLSMGGGGVGTMNLAGGTLIIDGDYRAPNGWLFDPENDTPHDTDEDLYTGTIAILAQRGLITAYDTNVGEIITDGNYPAKVGLRAVINLDYDVTNAGQTTITAAAVDPNLTWNPSPPSGTSGVIPPVTLSWSPGENAASHDVYFGTSFNDVDDANTANMALYPGVFRGNQPLADVNYTPPETLAWGMTYFWRVDEVNNPTWKGTIWNFAIPPAKATNPSPDDGTDDVSPIVVLSWTPGPEAVTHEVYISTDFNDVNDRDPNVLTIRGPNNYDPGTLEFSTLYYWAVDEVNLAAAVPRWYGDIWSFTTADYFIVDDFDSYGPDPALRTIWKDMWTGTITNNMAEIFVETTPDLVRDGNSMKYYYRNFDKSLVGCTAEADTVNLEVGMNWTAGGAKALVLYFHGDTANGQEPHKDYTIANDRLWISLLDGDGNEGIVRWPDMNAVMEAYWHEWNIDLQDPCFSDVNMANVAKVYLGFGGVKGGAVSKFGAGYTLYGDTVWFDDIRVWPPRCRSEMVATDFTGDCVTDLADVGVMSDDWLAQDANITVAEPCDVNLIGWWKFDEGDGDTVTDSSAYDNDGNTVSLTPSWVAGYPGDPCDSAMYFDGLSDYVVCAERDACEPGTYPEELRPDTFTISCWLKLYEFTYFGAFVTNGIDTDVDECGFFLYNWGWNYPGEPLENFGLAIRTETAMSYVETLPIYDTKRWYHLAATYDGQYANVYVDGLLVEGPTDVGGPMRWISANSNNYPENFVIGSWEDVDYSLHVDGTIDEVRFYNYALPQGEISVLAGIAVPGTIVYQPVPSAANLTDPEPKLSRKVNFRDYVILADRWLEGPTLWP